MTVSLDLAITAIRAKRREEARQLLNLLIQQNPNDELAWLWMSELVDSDERRARCLYHVLAINPDSPVARQGLQRLGIVLTDSRPVKTPAKTKAVSPAKPASPTNKPKQRSNHDPKAITQELPFTPLRDPFAEEESADDKSADSDEAATKKKLSDTKQRLRILSRALETEDDADQPAETDEPDSETVAPVMPPFQTTETAEAPVEPTESTMVAPPLKNKTKADTKPNGNVAATSTDKETDKSPDETEQPAVDDEATPEPAASNQAPSVPLPDFEQALSQINQNPLPNGFATGSVPITQPFLSSGGPAHKPAQEVNSLSSESRPMSAFAGGYVTPSNPTRPMPAGYQPSQMAGQQPYAGQMYVQLTRPSQPISRPPTLGMPVQHPGMYHSEPIPVIHANTTLGMPHVSPPNYSPLHHSNTTMSMPIPNGSAQFAAAANLLAPQADLMPRNNSQAVPGRSTQSDRELIAAWQNEHHKSIMSSEDDDEDEEVNILAIFVFGFLAITALGGFGVLTLLMMTGY